MIAREDNGLSIDICTHGVRVCTRVDGYVDISSRNTATQVAVADLVDLTVDNLRRGVYTLMTVETVAGGSYELIGLELRDLTVNLFGL